MKHLLQLIIISLLTMSVASCYEEEEFPTPADARLAFSVDSIDFDTIIARQASPTAQISVYNTSSKGVTITGVSIEGTNSDRFLANVDGSFVEPGIPLNIDCRGKDSIIAFVQFNTEDPEGNLAVRSEADIVFTLANGTSQRLKVVGYTQPIEEMRGIVITQNTTLDSDRPFAIFDSLVIAPGATLTIAPGNTLLFAADAGIRVEGTLLAEGTLQDPIVFKGNRFDDMFQNQPYDRIDNQWQGITFSPQSYGNHLNFCDIHSGSYGLRCDSSDVGRLKLTVENSIIHNVRHHGLALNQCQTFFGNTQITNAENNCIDVIGGDSRFIHCTVGWFSPFSTRRGNALVFRNHLNQEPRPIRRLEFINSIITGHNPDEIFAYTDDDTSVENNYAFHNCLLNTPEIKDNASVWDNIWESQKSKVRQADNFLNFDYHSLLYDFRLSADSPARYLADPAVTARYYPFDRLGTPRPTDQQPDAGCYQFVQPTAEE